MDMTVVEGSLDKVHKKSKKRKERESKNSRGEDDNVRTGDEEFVKKEKEESFVDDDLKLREKKKRKKERKEKIRIREGDVREASAETVQMEGAGGDLDVSGKGKKSKTADEIEAVSVVQGTPAEKIEEGCDDKGSVSSEKHRQKKKSRDEVGFSHEIGQTEHEKDVGCDDEGSRLSKKKKKKKEKSRSGDDEAALFVNEMIHEVCDDGKLQVTGTDKGGNTASNVLEAANQKTNEDCDDQESEMMEKKKRKEKKKEKKKEKRKESKSVGEALDEKEIILDDAATVVVCALGSSPETNDSSHIERSKKSTPGKVKKVQFSGEVEVLSPDNTREKEKMKKNDGKGKRKRLGKDNGGGKTNVEERQNVVDNGGGKKKANDGLIRGERFSIEEDEILKDSVYKYIERHQLGENGLAMILDLRSHRELKGCWKEIGEALPRRPLESVYHRGHILFKRSESCKWTDEELDYVKEYYAKHGPKWSELAQELGKHRFHVKDAYRRSKLLDRKTGHWSQDEYQKLFELVNVDLSMKVFQDKKSKHGMLRDNISWEAISDRLKTRTNSICCEKWYKQLTSPMVSAKIWADSDDYRLLMALEELDASCPEDVDWDNLLEHRSGDLCLKRWNEMVRHIGEHGLNPFNEQVEALTKRYCSSLLEARETYENKPFVD